MTDVVNSVNKLDTSSFNTENNLYIEASAGTGKTYTIKNIVARLVEKVSIDKILVVTYTEKAAGELRDRIRGIIEQKASESTDAELKKRYEEELTKVDNASIHTIHSFCQKTLEEFAFNAGCPFDMDLVDEGNVQSFVDKWIRDNLEKDMSWPELYVDATQAKLFGKEIEDSLIDGIKKYYLNSKWKEDVSVVALDDMFKVEKKDASKCVDCESLLGISDSDYLSKSFDNNHKKNHDDVFGRRFNKGVYSNTFLGNKRQYYKEKFLKKYVPILYKEWQIEKNRRKQQTYNDMIRNVREAVCATYSLLLEQLRAKYKYAIIDEFQDTNQLQWDIFSKVFLDSKDHYIYVVGDPKQAIYSFQGADVNVYKKAIDEIRKNGTRYVLDTNYRSSDTMVKQCNELFKKNTFFDSNSTAGLLTFVDSKQCGNIKDAKFDNEFVNPFWIAYENGDENSVKEIDGEKFAKIVSEKIVECCSYDENGKTKLQIYDKEKKEYRNVTFRDFAVLARTRAEMDSFKKTFTKSGIPWMLYKDTSLFLGMECEHWMILLKAIDADDFSGNKRSILSKALYTKFFGVGLDDVGKAIYDDPLENKRQMLMEWHNLARKRKWSKMVESILDKSKIEDRLATLDNLQSMIKFRQIGNYLIDYLQSNNCGLADAIKNLNNLSKKNSNDDGSIVAIGTDFDCVQFLTIHASKGLEFPVVIMAGGQTGITNQSKAFLYHDGNHESKLNFGYYGKEKNDVEIRQELERLFYVGLTRAGSIMMLAYYGNKIGSYASSLQEYIINNKSGYLRLPDPAGVDLRNDVKVILQNRFQHSVGDDEKYPDVSSLSGKAWGRRLRKHSYSSLSHGKSEETPELMVAETTGRSNKEGENVEGISLAELDQNGTLYHTYDDIQVSKTPISNCYPKGTELGSALHEVFEFADYANVGVTIDDAKKNDGLKSLINRCMSKYGFKILDNDSKHWMEQSVDFVWNTLNIKLPQIKGGKIDDKKCFVLKDNSVDRFAEVEFNMNVDEFKNYCTGSIDLMFRHDSVYSILDWKTDSIDPEIYGNAGEIKKVVDSHYSIQRVLYAYCLIQWLRQFNPEKSEDEIFNQYFGGVYYVFLRATEAGTFAGTYSHTWESWNDLKAAYDTIKSNKILKINKEDVSNE